ncbi:Phospholipid phosphatase 1 [Holothuria leucospilota]|uniref:Phospholipid phosphatase 1 n=1 Tax=Holothuria leucospilota TaxID=206669 RepID=A0A9Q1CCP6_HOLLE|nr:Phospholipid phosphatase 1 [Holothuria leucospilota]
MKGAATWSSGSFLLHVAMYIHGTKVPLVLVPVLLFRLPGVELPVFHRGFFCNDDSLGYPYKDSTVPAIVMYAVGIGLTFILVIITELFIYLHRQRMDVDYLSPKDDNHCCGGFMVPPLIFQMGRTLCVFGFGVLTTMAVTDVMKNVVGRLRPHFFSVCQPVLLPENCTDGVQNFYITADVCTGPDEDKLLEARRSFPSGHSSVSVYCMVYLAIYLQSRWQSRSLMYIRPMTQLIALMLATYTCLSRVSDYKHHWSDVLGGAILGTFIAVCMAFAVARVLRRKPSGDESYQNELFMEMSSRNRSSRAEGIF